MTRALLDMIPADLTALTTADRLNLVADIIEAHPEAHRQASWVSWADNHDAHPADVLPTRAAGGAALECGTAFCAAGWAVTLTPKDQVNERDTWRTAGAKALGLAFDDTGYPDWVAGCLFSAANARRPLITALRYLATLPEEDRTFAKLVEADLEDLLS